MREKGGMKMIPLLAVAAAVMAVFGAFGLVQGQQPEATLPNFTLVAKTGAAANRIARTGGNERTMQSIRTTSVDVNITFFAVPAVPYDVQCFFIAKSETTGQEFIFDALAETSREKNFVNTFASKPVDGGSKSWVSVPFSAVSAGGSVVSGTAVGSSEKLGNKIEGWIVRVVAAGRVVRVESNQPTLKEDAEKLARALDKAAASIARSGAVTTTGASASAFTRTPATPPVVALNTKPFGAKPGGLPASPTKIPATPAVPIGMVGSNLILSEARPGTLTPAEAEIAAGLHIAEIHLPDRRGLTFFHLDTSIDNQSPKGVFGKELTVDVRVYCVDGDGKPNVTKYSKPVEINAKGTQKVGLGGKVGLDVIKQRNGNDEIPKNVYLMFRINDKPFREVLFNNTEGGDGWWVRDELVR